MDGHGSLGSYETPTVSDYGGLMELTAAVHLLLGDAAGPDLTFSSPAGAGVTAGAGTSGSQSVLPDVASGDPSGSAGGGGPAGSGDVSGDAGSGAGGAGSGSGGGGSGGGELPFTGYAAAGAAALGAGLTAAGAAIRRGLRRR
jgi:hypothetical protein